MSTPTDPTHDQPELPAEVRDAIKILQLPKWIEDAVFAALAPLWPKQPQPSADVEKEVAGARLNREAGELAAKVAQWRKRAERAEAERDEWQLAYANWPATICPKLNAHSLAEAETNLNALLAERDQLRAEVHGWRLIHSEPDKVVQELNQLRAEVERLGRSLEDNFARGIHTCHDGCLRIECVQRREIADLRAQLAAAQQFNKRLADAAEEVLSSYILTKRVEEGHPCPENMVTCTTLRAAIDAARKEAQP